MRVGVNKNMTQNNSVGVGVPNPPSLLNQSQIDSEAIRLGDMGAVPFMTAGQKDFYGKKVEQRKVDSDVAAMLKGITQMQQLAPGRPRSLLTAPVSSNTLLTLIGNI